MHLCIWFLVVLHENIDLSCFLFSSMCSLLTWLCRVYGQVQEVYIQPTFGLTLGVMSFHFILFLKFSCAVDSPQLYVAFWTLSLYDLRVPVECYEAEIGKLRLIADEADANMELVRLLIMFTTIPGYLCFIFC